jgi:hypothetical protein
MRSQELRTLVIGRSPFADIVLVDASIASHHAELLVTDDGRLHLTDCGGGTGTWRRAVATPSDSGNWISVRQAFVRPDEAIRLGEHVCTARELLKVAREPMAVAGSAADTRRLEDGDGGGGRAVRARGRVERDPRTGEIIHRRS